MDNAAAERGTDCWTPELRRRVDEAARAAGFSLNGVAPVGDPDDPTASREAKRYAAWIDAGHAGEMDYLKRRDESGTLLRGSLGTAFPWARSVVVCALDYGGPQPRSIDAPSPSAGWIARYAWSGRTLEDGTTIPTDYHDDLFTRLRRIEAVMLEHTESATRCYVDTGPLLERSLAVQAGIGWTGKNTCVIHQQHGSWLLLGVILTSLQVGDHAAVSESRRAGETLGLPAADRCGTCTRCIDACPTGALLGSRSPAAPREMDATRCIAYLTIEKKGDIAEELRASIGRNVFGCDICQEVCPWNARRARGVTGNSEARPPSSGSGAMEARVELINPALDWLARMDSREFRRRFRGSPLERTGRKRLLRNVAVAMGNSGDPAFLPQLVEWANGAMEHANDVALREAATWAMEHIRSLKETPE